MNRKDERMYKSEEKIWYRKDYKQDTDNMNNLQRHLTYKQGIQQKQRQ